MLLFFFTRLVESHVSLHQCLALVFWGHAVAMVPTAAHLLIFTRFLWEGSLDSHLWLSLYYISNTCILHYTYKCIMDIIKYNKKMDVNRVQFVEKNLNKNIYSEISI